MCFERSGENTLNAAKGVRYEKTSIQNSGSKGELLQNDHGQKLEGYFADLFYLPGVPARKQVYQTGIERCLTIKIGVELQTLNLSANLWEADKYSASENAGEIMRQLERYRETGEIEWRVHSLLTPVNALVKPQATTHRPIYKDGLFCFSILMPQMVQRVCAP